MTNEGSPLGRGTARRLSRAARVVASIAEAQDRSASAYLLGACPVCGESTVFFAGPGPGQRESLVCAVCTTTSRYRSIALGILRCVRELTGIDVSSLARLPERSRTRLTVFDTQVTFRSPPWASYPIPEMLADRSWIDVRCSQYKPHLPLGAVLGPGTTNQNLEELTFADDSFDLVITSDVLEHVRLDDRAFREIARVLRPGGIFVFTVPHEREPYDTIVKVVVHDPQDPDADEILGVPEYHSSADAEEGSGVLSYRTYGTDLDDRLAALGFEVDYSCIPRPEVGVIDTELFYCRLGTVPS